MVITITAGKLQRLLLHEKLLVMMAGVKPNSPSFLQCSQPAVKTLTKIHGKEQVRK